MIQYLEMPGWFMCPSEESNAASIFDGSGANVVFPDRSLPARESLVSHFLSCAESIVSSFYFLCSI